MLYRREDTHHQQSTASIFYHWKPSVSYHCCFRLNAFNWWNISWLLLWSRLLTENVCKNNFALKTIIDQKCISSTNSGHLWYYLTTDQLKCVKEAFHTRRGRTEVLVVKPYSGQRFTVSICKFCKVIVCERKRTCGGKRLWMQAQQVKSCDGWLHWLQALWPESSCNRPVLIAAIFPCNILKWFGGVVNLWPELLRSYRWQAALLNFSVR